MKFRDLYLCYGRLAFSTSNTLHLRQSAQPDITRKLIILSIGNETLILEGLL